MIRETTKSETVKTKIFLCDECLLTASTSSPPSAIRTYDWLTSCFCGKHLCSKHSFRYRPFRTIVSDLIYYDNFESLGTCCKDCKKYADDYSKQIQEKTDELLELSNKLMKEWKESATTKS